MVLIDALHINNDGGKVLLDYLIEKLEQTDIELYYLLDDRIINNHPAIQPKHQVKYVKAGLLNRYLFYLKHQHQFKKILCFGNIPPVISVKAEVYTYFHQLQFLNVPAELNWKSRAKFNLKINVLKQFVGHTNFWLVQSKEVKAALVKQFTKIKADTVKIEPFYPPLGGLDVPIRKKNTFLYVSSGTPHKNHLNLLAAFCSFYDTHQTGELHLTISEQYTSISTLIAQAIAKNYPIVNHGFVARQALTAIYRSAEFAIYPSLTESFGMGLIEAIENGCKIIGADRPYLYAVCEPSLIFDPLSVDDMAKVMGRAVNEEVVESKQLVFDEIGTLINHLI